jgi:hypothetical protein
MAHFSDKEQIKIALLRRDERGKSLPGDEPDQHHRRGSVANDVLARRRRIPVTFISPAPRIQTTRFC